MASSSFRDLRVWQEAMKLAGEINKSTAVFPKHEVYGLSQQMRRAAVSVPSNIAEGKGHRSDKEFAHFLFHARGSLLELQTQLLIAEELQYLSKAEADRQLAVGRRRRTRAKRFNQFIAIKGRVRGSINGKRPMTDS